ncbi:hypothetical protein Microterr_25750 [Microbacterium terricola]|uniref:Secreted protein n=1 Tax=Microbacterium terricola TaxID=344163 RepID=A0ABM8E2A1_9MICO|nr:hypothetical protein Microterr_25750 [Microbacterium terricola]
MSALAGAIIASAATAPALMPMSIFRTVLLLRRSGPLPPIIELFTRKGAFGCIKARMGRPSASLDWRPSRDKDPAHDLG